MVQPGTYQKPKNGIQTGMGYELGNPPKKNQLICSHLTIGL